MTFDPMMSSLTEAQQPMPYSTKFIVHHALNFEEILSHKFYGIFDISILPYDTVSGLQPSHSPP